MAEDEICWYCVEYQPYSETADHGYCFFHEIRVNETERCANYFNEDKE